LVAPPIATTSPTSSWAEPVNSQRDLVLVGGGGHCRSCIDVVEASDEWRIVAILDVASRVGERILGHAICGTDDDIDRLAAGGAAFLIALGQIKSAGQRRKLFEMVRLKGGLLPTIVSPLAYVSPHASLGVGTIVMHRATVNAGATIGDNVIINSLALVEHDAQVGNDCHVSTAAVVNGDVVIGVGSFIGSNAVLHHGCEVPANAIVPAGATYRKQDK
jgi:sugar O-acyltransferase (sialic acid O-acetyltransferase NeuD family)